VLPCLESFGGGICCYCGCCGVHTLDEEELALKIVREYGESAAHAAGLCAIDE